MFVLTRGLRLCALFARVIAGAFPCMYCGQRVARFLQVPRTEFGRRILVVLGA